MSLPTVSGSTCWYSIGSTRIALACSPALCANADSPTYGWWLFGAMFVTSETACAMRVISPSDPFGSTLRPFFSCRLAMTENRLALPERSPYPLAVPCTCVAPASTAASELATAHAVSSWQWMPSLTWVACSTSLTTSAIPSGSMPPLVSHRATRSAPASTAAATTSSAYDRLEA